MMTMSAVQRTPAVHTAVRVAATIFFAVLLGASALVRIPLPGTPVPVTLQTFTLLVGAGFLGARYGLAMVGLCVALGMVGAPFFAGGSGAAYLIGPTGGYLIGFALAAWIVGRFDRADRGLATKLALYAAAAVALYVPGLLQLKVVSGASWSLTLAMGLAPFIVGDVVKAVAAGAGVRATRKMFHARSS
jgi:biotin transport system substrate-specific component